MNEPLSGPVVVYLSDPLPSWWVRFLTESKNIFEELKAYKIKHINNSGSRGKTMFSGAVIFPSEKTYTWFLIKWV
jgi:hypothetical protein